MKCLKSSSAERLGHEHLQCFQYVWCAFSEVETCVFLLPLQHHYQNKLKLAIIGQSLFGQEVYSNLRKQGHKVVGVFTVPDKDGKADPLGKFPVHSQVSLWYVRYQTFNIAVFLSSQFAIIIFNSGAFGVTTSSVGKINT